MKIQVAPQLLVMAYHSKLKNVQNLGGMSQTDGQILPT
jgi:hypothetical protein